MHMAISEEGAAPLQLLSGEEGEHGLHSLTCSQMPASLREELSSALD